MQVVVSLLTLLCLLLPLFSSKQKKKSSLSWSGNLHHDMLSSDYLKTTADVFCLLPFAYSMLSPLHEEDSISAVGRRESLFLASVI